MKKQNAIVTAVAVAALAGGAAVAVPAFAATGDTGNSGSGSSTTGTATPGTGDSTRTAPHQASLDKLVQDGTITQAQADKIKAQLESDRPARGEGRGGHGKGMGGMGRMGGGDMLDTAATTLKLSADELRTKLETQSLGKIADEAGVSRDSLVDAATTDMKERITEMLDRTPGERAPRGDNSGGSDNNSGSQAPGQSPSSSSTAS